MENATKALMIAGAVLIAIMIIGIGMMIYQNASGTINGAMSSVDQISIDSFNSDILPFEGDQKGTQVKSLITKVITLNSTNKDINPEKIISVDGKTESADLTTIRAGIVAGKTYTITLGYGAAGYINTITTALKGSN